MMKKVIKKLLAALLAVAMLCAMAVPALAAGSAASTFTITAPSGTHQYEIYQIFTGDYSKKDGNDVLSNIKWGVNGKFTGINEDDLVSKTVLDDIASVASGSDAEKLAVITTYADLTHPVATITNGGTYSAVAGYYLIKDKDNSLSGTETYTTYLVKVVGNVTITPKTSDTPTFFKKLKDTNDTTGDTSDWQDSADYDIGDSVPFKLEGTVPSDYERYTTYYYAFHDVAEHGLTFDKTSVEVFVDGAKIISGYTVTTPATDGCTFEVIFNNLKDIPAVNENSHIVVTYNATLNDTAVLGKKGNVNKAMLKFSNNPNGSGHGETPWDSVIVFTYKVVVNKRANAVDGDLLPGAEFTLSKKLKDGSTKDIAVVKNTEGTTFTFSGLDDGDYVLTETKTPEGYNTIAPIKFTVDANHKINWESEDRSDILTSLTGSTATGELTFTADEVKAALSTDVVNKAGTTLPSTGGMGTTLFYVVGGGLMVAAIVLLVTKKRMENK